MKKLLTVLLVALLALTMTVSAFAAEPVKDEETGVTSISLLNCDTKPSGGNAYTVDTENAQEGDACLSFNTAKGQINAMVLPETIDGTGYDSLEFDLYLSDVTVLDKFKDSGLEITSSGESDYQEISWNIASIKENNKGGELVEGWNHIILPLSSAKSNKGDVNSALSGDFDIAKINYMRFYMVGAEEDTGAVIKVDDFRLSDYEAAQIIKEQEAQAKEIADKVNSRIEKLEEVTADNYKAMKTKIASIRSQYDKLSEVEQRFVDADLWAKLEEAEAKVAEFIANPPAEQPEDDNTDKDQPSTDDEGDDTQGGCNAAIGFGSVAMLVTALSLGVTALKKKD